MSQTSRSRIRIFRPVPRICEQRGGTAHGSGSLRETIHHSRKQQVVGLSSETSRVHDARRGGRTGDWSASHDHDQCIIKLIDFAHQGSMFIIVLLLAGKTTWARHALAAAAPRNSSSAGHSHRHSGTRRCFASNWMTLDSGNASIPGCRSLLVYFINMSSINRQPIRSTGWISWSNSRSAAAPSLWTLC